MTDAKPLLAGLDERVFVRRGASLRYFAGGEGPALLLVHGYGGAAWNFAELVPLLAPGRRLLIPDLPGHAGSTPLPATESLSVLADLLAALLEHEGVAQADLVGHSMGGVVALRLAERRPELVRRIVLAASAGIGSATRSAELTIGFFGIVQPGRRIARRIDRVARSERLKRIVFGRWTVSDSRALSERAVYSLLQGPAVHTDALSSGLALVRGDPRRDLHRVRAPVLCLWGARDNQVPLRDAREYARRLHAPLRAIADTGHLLIAERPRQCAHAITQFLG